MQSLYLEKITSLCYADFDNWSFIVFILKKRQFERQKQDLLFTLQVTPQLKHRNYALLRSLFRIYASG